MEQLNSLIKDASNQFECHNFQTSLSLYRRCIDRCLKQQFPIYILHNLKSSVAALQSILGNLDAALLILDQVLSENKQHWLSLMRRSQIYKKQTKYKKALKDLDVLSMFAPDNMQVAALKLELKGLMVRPNGNSSSQSESEQEIEKVDEEQILQFSNLKKIDRTSVSIMIPKGRQSRVTITGDKSFFYEANEQQSSEPIRKSITFTPSFNCQRFIDIDKELQETNESDHYETPIVKIKTQTTRSKSILRNRDSKIYKSQTVDPQAHDQQKKLISKVQNIDGSVISPDIGSNKRCSDREVGFRKSLFAQEIIPQILETIPKTNTKPASRKSCLKMSINSTQSQQTNGPQRRSSKFDSMTRGSIDGKLIKSDKKRKEAESESSKQNARRPSVSNSSESDSEGGSHYNIFGSKKVVLNKELRENLGLGSDPVLEQSPAVEIESKTAKKKERGQSILKKSSLLEKKEQPKKKASIFFKQNEGMDEEEQPIKKPERKNKKSVMFISC